MYFRKIKEIINGKESNYVIIKSNKSDNVRETLNLNRTINVLNKGDTMLAKINSQKGIILIESEVDDKLLLESNQQEVLKKVDEVEAQLVQDNPEEESMIRNFYNNAKPIIRNLLIAGVSITTVMSLVYYLSNRTKINSSIKEEGVRKTFGHIMNDLKEKASGLIRNNREQNSSDEQSKIIEEYEEKYKNRRNEFVIGTDEFTKKSHVSYHLNNFDELIKKGNELEDLTRDILDRQSKLRSFAKESLSKTNNHKDLRLEINSDLETLQDQLVKTQNGLLKIREMMMERKNQKK